MNALFLIDLLLITELLDSVENPAIILPDKGADRYELEELGYPIFHCDKQRDPVTGKLLGFEVPTVEQLQNNQNLLIVDDICDGGGTFIGIADKLKAQGNYNLALYVTHGIFSKGFYELFKRFDVVYTTDTFGYNRGLADINEQLNVVSLWKIEDTKTQDQTGSTEQNEETVGQLQEQT